MSLMWQKQKIEFNKLKWTLQIRGKGRLNAEVADCKVPISLLKIKPIAIHM